MRSALHVMQACMALFGSPLGQEVLRDLEAEFFERTSFSLDPYQTAYLEGQRFVIATIRHRCREGSRLSQDSLEGKEIHE